MDAYHEAHFFSSPSQGNVYTYATVTLRDNSVVFLHAPLNDKVFALGFETGDLGRQLPYRYEVPFAHVPEGSEIVAIDAFNRAYIRDDIFIGLAIKKKKDDRTVDFLFNVYSKPERDLFRPFNLTAAANHCVIIDLKYAPFHLTHAMAVSQHYDREMVFLLTGDDEEVHLYNDDPLNKVFCEASIKNAFPEIIPEKTVILWVDVMYTKNYEKRIVALACRDGSVRLIVTNPRTGDLMSRCSERFDGPVTRVILFKGIPDYEDIDDYQRVFVGLIPVREEKKSCEPIHLFIANSISLSSVRMDILQNGLFLDKTLPKSNTFDVVISACACDFDCDRSVELIIGTFSSVIFIYKYLNDNWVLIGRDRMAHSVHWIGHESLTHDGLREIIIGTSAGIHIYQPNPEKTLKVFCQRYAVLLQRFKNKRSK